jgi:hypothetical protein
MCVYIPASKTQSAQGRRRDPPSPSHSLQERATTICAAGITEFSGQCSLPAVCTSGFEVKMFHEPGVCYWLQAWPNIVGTRFKKSNCSRTGHVDNLPYLLGTLP